MKKILCIIGILVLMATTIYAGSVSDLDYKDQYSLFGTERNRVINDNNVNIDADTLNGETNADIVNTANIYTDSRVTTETNNRINGDNNLQSQINTETTNRQTADTTERNNRINGDNNLQSQINNERFNRIVKDIELENDIKQEADRRRQADNMEAFTRSMADYYEANARRTADNNEAQTRETNDNAINNYINSNSVTWSQDTSGISYASMVRFVLGTNWDIMGDYDTFLDYIKSLFATKKEIARLNDRINRLELELKYLEDKYNMPVDKKLLNYKYALIISDENDEEVTTSDGFVCNSNINACYKIKPMPQEEPVVIVEEPLVNNTQYNEKVLKEWQRLCDSGNKMWCDIIDNNKDKLN